MDRGNFIVFGRKSTIKLFRHEACPVGRSDILNITGIVMRI